MTKCAETNSSLLFVVVFGLGAAAITFLAWSPPSWAIAETAQAIGVHRVISISQNAAIR
jgi:hypothetical protein